MSSWQGKTRGTPLGYRIFIFLIKNFGISSAYLLLYFVSFYFVFFGNKKSQKFFYDTILGQKGKEAFMSRFRNNFRFGQVLIDKVAAFAGQGSLFSFDFDGEEHLRNLKDGGFLIGAHMGNWEIAGELLKRLETPVNIVMVQNEHAGIKELLNEVESQKTMKIIWLSDDMSHVLAIKQAIERKELVVIHGDRFMEGAPFISKKFLNKEAKFPYGPFYLAARFNKPVCFTFAFKETNTHYHFYSTPGKRYPAIKNVSQRAEITEMILDDYLVELEKMTMKYPHQWFNFYDFWEEEKYLN